MKTSISIIRLLVLTVILAAASANLTAQPAMPNPPNPLNPTNGPNTNSPTPTFAVVTNLLVTTGTEILFVDTLPTVPDPTQVFPSWATIHSGGLVITTNGLIDTNAIPSDSDGMPAGNIVGVVLDSDTNSPFTITRGVFDVLLTNSNGELQNTRFEIKIMRNTNDFADLFTQEMALAEYQTNSTQLSLTPLSGVSNGYALAVQFPPCVWAGARVLSIRTEPLDFDLPFAQLQWLQGSGDTNAIATYTTDQTPRTLRLN